MFASRLIGYTATFTKSNLRVWLRSLTQMAHRRAIIRQSVEMVDRTYQEADAALLEADRGESHRENLALYADEQLPSIVEATAEFDAMRERISKQESWLLTGIPQIDQHTCILPDFILVLARTKVGKTALTLGWAMRQAIKGNRVLYFSMEQDRARIVAKLISQLTGLSGAQVIGTGGTTAEQRGWITQARDFIAELPLTVVDGSRTAESLWSTCANQKEKVGCDICYVDQMDKFVFDPRLNTLERQMAAVSKSLFAMRAAVQLPVILLAQLSLREARQHPVPRKEHLRDCTQLLQDADQVFVLDRPGAEMERMAMYAEKQNVARKMGDAKAVERLDYTGVGVLKLEEDRNGTGGGVWQERIRFDETCGRYGPQFHW
jgi:replicative DNA helicase